MEGPLNKGNFERLLQSEFRTVSNGRELSKSLALLDPLGALCGNWPVSRQADCELPIYLG